MTVICVIAIEERYGNWFCRRYPAPALGDLLAQRLRAKSDTYRA
jgi:uncharacterized protein (DUF3820 family)